MENEVTNVGFTVDAGLIQRLGYELVGRAETAVSELIKNSYDADATVVDVDFIMAQLKQPKSMLYMKSSSRLFKRMTEVFPISLLRIFQPK